MRSDGGASAPFAVVAVVVLLGAGISYAYLASYRSTRENAGDLPAWTDGPHRALAFEQERIEGAVKDALDRALDPVGILASGTIVSTIGSMTEHDFLAWAAATYPCSKGPYQRSLENANLTVLPIYGRVLAGNPIGQRTYQTLPVGVQVIATGALGIRMGERSLLEKDVVVRLARPCPQLLAAHFENLLECSLAEDGLVPALMADAISASMAQTSTWYPSVTETEALLKRAVYSVERSFFNRGSGVWSGPYEALQAEGADVLDGGDLVGLPGLGAVSMELPQDDNFILTFPPTGELLRFTLVPYIERVNALEVETSHRDYAAAEAKGHGNASAVRATYGLSIEHRVLCAVGEARAGTVARTIESRASLMAWAWDRPGLEADGHEDPQVENWTDFEAAMSVAGSAVGTLPIKVEGALDRPVNVTMDGVPLGEYPRGELTLRNVVCGRHDLTVFTDASGQGVAICSTAIEVGTDPADGPMHLTLQAGQDDVDDFTFWFSLMASYHRPGSSRIPYLEYIAQLSGYPPAPTGVAADPTGHLDELLFWEEGLARHLDRMGSAWTPVDGPVKGSFWHKAGDVLSIYNLAQKTFDKLPKELITQGRICVLLDSAGGRESLKVYLESQNDKKKLFEARAEPEGFTVTFGKENPRLVTSFKSGMALLSVVSSAYSVWKDVINVGEALDDGWTPRAGFAVMNLTIDIVRTVMAAVNLFKELGLITLSELAKGCIGIISAAISIISAFMSAYREAGGDVWAAFEILGHPGAFSAALRTAMFLQGIVTIYVAVFVGVCVPAITSAIVTGACAAAMSTGVGFIVFGLVLAVWAVLNWEKVCAWFNGWIDGTATRAEVKAAKEGIEDLLASTMRMRAQLNRVDVEGELYRARLERGTGLGLMEARSVLPDDGLVSALGRQDLRHLDDGASQARRAKAVAEVNYWIEVLWCEVDDFVDEDSVDKADGLSEGFTDDKGTFGVDHDFRADIHVTDPAGLMTRLSQRDGTLVGFLRGLDMGTVDGSSVELDIWGKDGMVYGPALHNWEGALDSILMEVRRCVDNITVASRETAYAALLGSGSQYQRGLSVVEVVTGEGVPLAQVDILSRGLLQDGTLVGGIRRVEVEGGSRMLVVAPGLVESTMYGYGLELERLESRCNATASRWCDPSFGRAVLDHMVVIVNASATKG